MSVRGRILLGLLALLTLTCVGGGLWSIGPTLPMYHAAARERWNVQQPRHYQMEVRWQSGGWVVRATVEVRDECSM